ncbi:MAG: TiaS agmantine-binding domain-containing protein [Candidatus Ranarchaeia archaeon]
MSNEVVKLHIGLDDTDGPQGNCTTYLATLLIEFLIENFSEIEFIDYPNLIRLNPNIPHKTRGNAAISISIRIKKEESDLVFIKFREIFRKIEIQDNKTNPALVIFKGEIPQDIKKFGEKTLSSVIEIKEAIKLVRKYKKQIQYFTLNGEIGIIGALAAIGNLLEHDHTFELITYREEENWGKKRSIDEASVFKVSKNKKIDTFNNVDPENKRVLITPHGPDPVLYGIRGEERTDVYYAYKKIRTKEPISKWMIFRSNQGTDAHLRSKDINELKPCEPAIITGTIDKKPQIEVGGHVFSILDNKSGRIFIAAYEPSKEFRKIVLDLREGDEVTVSGSTRTKDPVYPLTLNLEKITVNKLKTQYRESNPKCTECNVSLKSMGTDKGYRCPKCRKRYREEVKERSKIKRKIQTGIFLPPLGSQRHLTKPLSRYGKEKRDYDFPILEVPWNSFQKI